MATVPQLLVGALGPENSVASVYFTIDPAKYTRQSVQVIRQQADQSNEPGEHSLNPAGLWRRSQESWHHGAGQLLLDGKTGLSAYNTVTADPERFYSSYGIDCWSRGKLTLLRDTTVIRSSTVPSELVTASNYVYLDDSAAKEVYWSLNPTAAPAAWTAANINAGQAAQSPVSLATNGSYVWAALGSSGLHRTVVGAAVSTADVPAQGATGGFCGLVGYALGRLLVANANVLYEIDDPLGTPAARVLMTHSNIFFVWGFVQPGRNVIYAGGNAGGVTSASLSKNWGTTDVGGTGEVYRITLEPVGTQLGAPIQATYLPDGESVYNVQFYAGGVLLSTSRGFRVGVADTQGNIDYGPLITAAAPAIALEPQDRYAWSGSDVGGLRRFDLGFFIDTLTPAWADDINTNSLATVNAASPGDFFCPNAAVSTFTSPQLVYATGNDHKVIRQSSNYVASGQLRTGQIRFGTTDKKQGRRLDLKHLALPAGSSITAEIAYDGGAFVSLGASTGTSTATTWSNIASTPAEVFELRFTLNRGTDPTTTPTLLRWTFHALPIPTRTLLLQIPIIMKSSVDNGVGDGQPLIQSVPTMLGQLGQWERDSTVLLLQLGDDVYTGYIAASQHTGEHWNLDRPARRYIEGTYVIDFQTVIEWP